MYQSLQEAKAAWVADRVALAARGVILPPSVASYLPEPFKRDFGMAMDAQPALSTEPNAGIPTMLSTYIDPAVFRILFAPNKAVTIFGEVKKGDWTLQTTMFPQVEHTGEVTSYGDYGESGNAGVNVNWPNRQSYLFQLIKQYGELEVDRAGLGKINWITEIDLAAATVLNKFSNLTYFYGVAGLENYGLFTDPNLSAPLTPATKAAGGTAWITNGVITATANEIYADIQSIYLQLVSQTTGLVQQDAKMCLAMSPQSQVALTATNSFGVNVYDLLKKNFPNLRFETAVQYGVLSASNPQGVAAGNFVQLIADETEGQKTGYCAFNEKMRAHPIVRMLSAWKQKVTAGTWGAVVRMPMNFASMVGV
jgi:hypothetical protein